MKILETDRLILREMEPSDYDDLCKILQDREVMYAYEHAFSDQEAKDWLERQFTRYRTDGFGLWAVILKETGEMIGQCGLSMQDWKDGRVLEVGYLFQKAFWHHGYAIEGAKACKQYAFETLHADRVYTIIRDTNVASQRVATKNGMSVVDTSVKHYYNMDMPHLLFSISREEYEAQRNSGGN